MPSKLDRAAALVGDAVGTIETATGAAGTRVQQGLSKAATAIAESSAVDRMEKKTRPIRRAAAEKAVGIKKTAKRRATTAAKKATGAKKTAKRRATTAAKKATGAKKTAKKRSPARR
jgi:DNA-binding protein HU-beta